MFFLPIKPKMFFKFLCYISHFCLKNVFSKKRKFLKKVKSQKSQKEKKERISRKVELIFDEDIHHETHHQQHEEIRYKTIHVMLMKK